RCRAGRGGRRRSRRRASSVRGRPAEGRPSAELLVQVADARLVVRLAGPERPRELVVPVRLVRLALLLEAAAEDVVRVVVVRGELQHRAELGLGLVPALDAEVREAQRLADRRLVRLPALRLLE